MNEVRSGRAVSYREAAALSPQGLDLPYIAWAGAHVSTGIYRPDYVELFLVTGGAARRVVRRGDDASEEVMLPGALYLFRPMDQHEIVSDARLGLSVVCVAFPVSTWERFALVTGLDQRSFTLPDPPKIDVDLADRKVVKSFHRIVAAFTRRPDGMDLVRFLVAMIPRFGTASDPADESGVPVWLRTAVTAMHEEINLRAGVRRFAQLAHVSHSHLWRTTRAYFDVSPTELVSEIRIRHAALLLTSTDTPVAVIAERCGYSSAAHFSGAFRRSRMVSPREFRTRSRAR